MKVREGEDPKTLEFKAENSGVNQSKEKDGVQMKDKKGDSTTGTDN